MEKIINLLAYRSFIIMKVILSISFMLLIIDHYFISESNISFMLIPFIFISGMFIGYVFAYYSIKYLRKE